MNIQDLIHIFETLGIGKGDNVLVSSDVMRLLQYLCADDRKKLRSSKAKAAILDEIIDGLQNLVGEEGTLLFPTYNWGSAMVKLLTIVRLRDLLVCCPIRHCQGPIFSAQSILFIPLQCGEKEQVNW